MCCSDPPSGKGLAAKFGVWAAPALAADLYHRADRPAALPAIVAEQGGDRKNHPFSPEPANAGDGTLQGWPRPCCACITV